MYLIVVQVVVKIFLSLKAGQAVASYIGLTSRCSLTRDALEPDLSGFTFLCGGNASALVPSMFVLDSPESVS